MKKIRLILSAVLMMTAFGFIACSHSASGSSSSGGSNNTSTGNNSKYHVGDIILNDGTVLRDTTSVSDTDKAKAIAVIYKVTGSKAYGVGLVHNRNGLKWCLESANGYSTNIYGIMCKISGSAGNLSFAGDTDGSYNIQNIAHFLGDDDNDTGNGNYPALEFAIDYYNQTNSHVSKTAYAYKWYLPTVAELYDIWKIKATINAKTELCGGSQFGNDLYWSSSQDASDERFAYGLDFSNGSYCNNTKFEYTHSNVCCIRVFE